MRRVTITITEEGGGVTATASVSTESNTYGNGAVLEHIEKVTKGVMIQWAARDPQSARPKSTGRPRPAPRTDQT